MTMTSMTASDVRALLAKVVPTIAWTQVGDDEALGDAGLDSLDKASVIMELEKESGVDISDERYDELNTIAELAATTYRD